MVPRRAVLRVLRGDWRGVWVASCGAAESPRLTASDGASIASGLDARCEPRGWYFPTRGSPLSRPAQAGARGTMPAQAPGLLGPGRAEMEVLDVRWASQRCLVTSSAADSPSSPSSPPPSKDIRASELVLRPAAQLKAPGSDLSELRFGVQFTQHMLRVVWSRSHGWGAPLICPLEPLPLHPAAQVLQYGMSCFEGMKAYKGLDGSVRLFRPTKNMERLSQSCHRLNLPAFDKEEFLECIKELLRVERDWIPARDGYSMYLRPFAMATTPFLGVGPPTETMLVCILSPAGPYFPHGLKPVALFVDTKHVRAFPGGVGDCKLAGNYGPTILPQVEAAKAGCSQVLYVLKDFPTGPGGEKEGQDEEEDGWVGESGAMNVFFLLRSKGSDSAWDAPVELVTPPLDGTILPGVTRDSVLELVRSWNSGIRVSERPIRLKELKSAHEEGRLLEVFGTGTAVIVQPVEALVLRSGRRLDVPVDETACSFWTSLEPGKAHVPPTHDFPFSLTGRLYRALLDIQYGHVDHPWSVKV